MSRLLGAICQNGYVVRDIHAAMAHWSSTLSVGPFFFFEQAPLEKFCYKGEPSACRCSIALANSGDLQVELIQQLNDEPSMYRDFLASGNEGLQHLAFWTEDMDNDLEHMQKLGYRVGQSGQVGDDGRFVYYDTGGPAGTTIELSEISGAKGEFFDYVRQAALDWDGSDPVVRVGG